MRSVSGSTIDNGNSSNSDNSYLVKPPEYSESLESIRGDEYLDPITGEFTTNDTIGDVTTGIQNDSNSSPFSNEVYNKNQILDTFSLNADISRSNDNYGKIFNDYNNGFQYKIAQQQSFSNSGTYPQINVSSMSSSGTSSLTSSSNNTIMNMTSF